MSAVVCIPLLASCGGSDCPLGVVIEIPILTIRNATNSATGAAIPQVVLSDIRILGRLQSGNEMQHLLSDLARNATVEGNQLRCTLECAFSTDYGDYQFTVSAPGHTSKTVSIPDVRYTEFERDACRNTPTAGTTISLELDPAQ